MSMMHSMQRCKMHCRLHYVCLCALIRLILLVTRCQSAELQTSSTLTLGSTIWNTTTLASPGGVFELGFTSRVRKNLSTQVYTLAIWYANANKTAVWVAPDRDLALHSNQASLSLSTLGDLQIYDNSGASPKLVWHSDTADRNVVNVSIEDTGNLVMVDNNNTVVWQSFDYPTDTLLPTQIFDFPKSLVAWENDGDWSAGNYTLGWFNSTYLRAYWRIPYPWEIPTWRYWAVTEFSSVYLTSGGDFRGKRATEAGSASIGAPAVLAAPNRLLRLTLDKDGNLRMYSWSAGSTNWTIEWAVETDDCSIHGTCGPYSICVASTCTCPTGFQWVDATDRRFGCQRIKSPAYCAAGNSNIDGFVPVLFADWRFNDLAQFLNVNLSHCMEQCLAACDCEAVIATPPDATTNITSNCWHKRFALIDGFPTDTRHSYLRVGGSNLSPEPPSPSPVLPALQSPGGPQSRKLKTILPTTIAGALLLLALLWICLVATRKVRQKLDSNRLKEKWVAAKGCLVRFTFKEILLITAKFEHRIGEGGFGTVFRGQLTGVGDRGVSSPKSGQLVTVAVKRLNKELSSQVEKEFMNEVEILGVIHHVHLVLLLGYCSEAEHRLLVYEYLENGSLDKILFRSGKNLELPILEWDLRFAIALATARGLAYLHDDCKQRIIHCDVKPENILLDSTYCAKVADFGLSRIKNRGQTTQTVRSATNHIRGTLGYLAPEYWRPEGVTITNKVDVFSFGMVLLEIISGRRNVRPPVCRLVDSTLDSLYFPSWAFPKIETEAYMDLVDPALAGMADPVQVKRALRVAFWCIQDKPHVRPSMSDVVQMLQGHAIIGLPVPRPVFFNDVDQNDDGCNSAEQISSSYTPSQGSQWILSSISSSAR